MGFLEKVEVTIYMLPIIALLTGVAFGVLSACVSIFIAWALGAEIISVLKIASLAGFLGGVSIGIFVSLAYLFKKATATEGK